VIFLLDTNAISDLMKAEARLEKWLSSLRDEDRLVTCVIARGEILFGLARLAEGRRRLELEQKAANILAALPCESIPERAAEFYAHAKCVQQRRGLSLDENDLWIAATALALDATLVTRDTDFQQIEHLRILALGLD